jgi:hypothetical protein
MITAVIFGDGSIRWAALILAALFFFGTAGPFFCILAQRSHVFYPPREYGSPSVSDYADAMLRRPPAQLRRPDQFVPAIQAEVRQAMMQGMIDALAESGAGGRAAALDAQLLQAVERLVNDAVFVILRVADESAPFGHANTYLSYGAGVLATEFLADASEWVASLGVRDGSAQEVMRSYGKAWAWRDTLTGDILLDLAPPADATTESTPAVRDAGLRQHATLDYVDLHGLRQKIREAQDRQLTNT